jgi:transcriptional regulator with XRE-family HTH domain
VHDPSPNQAAPNLNPAALESVANPPTIGEKLRELREQIGLSQMEVAILCGVDVSTISRWERGRHQHTHRSKDRQIRAALEALQWAAELQEEDAARVLTLEEVQEYVNRRRRARGGSR